MPKVTRRKSAKPKSSGSTLVIWKKVTIIALPVLLFLFVINQSQGSVLGISDFAGKKANTSPMAKPSGACKPVKISSVTFSSACDDKLGFQKVSYSCADGTSSSISSTSCGNPQQLFEKVMKACNKNAKCKPSVSKMPRPSGSENQRGGMMGGQRGQQNQQGSQGMMNDSESEDNSSN